jgi:hypothetical protein
VSLLEASVGGVAGFVVGRLPVGVIVVEAGLGGAVAVGAGAVELREHKSLTKFQSVLYEVFES